MSPGDLVVRILGFHCCDPSSVPGWGIEILQMTHLPTPPPEKKSLFKVKVKVSQYYSNIFADGDQTINVFLYHHRLN